MQAKIISYSILTFNVQNPLQNATNPPTKVRVNNPAVDVLGRIYCYGVAQIVDNTGHADYATDVRGKMYHAADPAPPDDPTGEAGVSSATVISPGGYFKFTCATNNEIVNVRCTAQVAGEPPYNYDSDNKLTVWAYIRGVWYRHSPISPVNGRADAHNDMGE